MFPMKFDHKVLETLPVPDTERIQEVLQILRTITMGRVIPYFRKKKGTDPSVIARVVEHLVIKRLEDEENHIHIVSLLSREDKTWIIHVHERIFDYLAFVIPSDPESRLGGHTGKEKKVLAFTEFLLRHEIEHALYPKRSEREVIRSDVKHAEEILNKCLKRWLFTVEGAAHSG